MREGLEEGFESDDWRWSLSALERCRQSVSLQPWLVVGQKILQRCAGACTFDSPGWRIPDTSLLSDKLVVQAIHNVVRPSRAAASTPKDMA